MSSARKLETPSRVAATISYAGSVLQVEATSTRWGFPNLFNDGGRRVVPRILRVCLEWRHIGARPPQRLKMVLRGASGSIARQLACSRNVCLVRCSWGQSPRKTV